MIDSPKLKEFAGHNFKFDENGKKLFKRVKTLCVKEELLVMGNFSFHHSIFNPLPDKPCLQYKCFENTTGKGEIARNKQFLLFLQCCLLIWRTATIFVKFEIVICKQFQFERV